jgi:hypothetical protein
MAAVCVRTSWPSSRPTFEDASEVYSFRLDLAGCTLVGAVVTAVNISGGGGTVAYRLWYSALRRSISSSIRRSVTRL